MIDSQRGNRLQFFIRFSCLTESPSAVWRHNQNVGTETQLLSGLDARAQDNARLPRRLLGTAGRILRPLTIFPNATRRIADSIRKAGTDRLFAERGRVEHLALGFDFLHVVGFGQR
jgi:hypothetical protein